jgi:hypothetical protein
MKLSKIIAFSVLLLLKLSVNGQTFDYYRFYSGVFFLPSCGFKSELYSKTDKVIVHYSKNRSYKNCKNVTNSNLPIDKNIESKINFLDSLFKIKSFKFDVADNLIEKMKKDTFYKEYYHVSDIDIDTYFKSDINFILSFDKVKPDTTDNEEVVDCDHFSFILEGKRDAQDTIKYKYSGNYCDGVKSRDIKNWLPFYVLNKRYKVFESIKNVAEFLDDKHFRSVAFRFIAWQKND